MHSVELCCPKCKKKLAVLAFSEEDAPLILTGEVKIKCSDCEIVEFACIGLPNQTSFIGAEKGQVHEF